MRALVTGGGGFLGGRLVELLTAEGWTVRSFARGEYPALAALGVETLRGDLQDSAAVRAAVAGCDVVFHVAARTGVFGPRAAFFGPNVEGTRHVLAACLAAGVRRLVHTGSPSVTFDGRPHRMADETLPHAARFLCAYPESKAVAERLVLAANGEAGLATCVLRPHLIFGPGDPHLVPRLLQRARSARLAQVGDGTNEVSLCYVDNAAAAHLDAVRGLTPGAAHAGRAYFVAQQEPVVLWRWIAELLERSGLPYPRRRLSLRAAYGLGAALETLWRTLGRPGEPPMTRFVAQQLATDHTYTMEPARRDFGYRERVDLREATERLLRSLVREPAAEPADARR